MVDSVGVRPFPDPSILLHPQIPKPLHLLTPRTILGPVWWDRAKKEAYGRHDLHCHACGILKYDAEYRQWLEAHEMYDIDFTTGRVVFLEVVALCHFCHNYIHRGRLEYLLLKGEISLQHYVNIVRHGDAVLKAAELPLDSNEQLFRILQDVGKLCRWEDYYLVINGVRYEQRFKSYKEWEQYWQEQGSGKLD